MTVTDNNGCSDVAGTSLYGFLEPIEVDVVAVPCFTSNGVNYIEGELTATVTGGCLPYTYTWTGPDGEFLSSSSTISGINEPGEYCITVGESCSSEISDCISIICDCNEAPSVSFYISNPCVYGGIWDDGTADITIDHIINMPTGAAAAKFFIEYFNGATRIGTAEIEGNNEDWVLLSGTNHIEVGEGVYNVRVTHESGCSLTYTYEFHKPFGCDYDFGTTTLQSQFNNEGLSDERIIFRCESIENTCGTFSGGLSGWGNLIIETFFLGGLFYDESDSDYGTLRFYPCDEDDPCNSGGFLKCSVQCDQSSYWVPPNIDGQLIQVDDNTCGCLFPEKTIYHFLDDNLPVFGILTDCTNPATHSACDGSEPVIPPPPPSDIECPSECSECISQPSEFDDCTMDIFCVNDNENTYVDSYSRPFLCREGSNDPFYPGSNLFLGCGFNDPCVLTYLGTMGYEEGFYTFDGLFFDWLDQFDVENPEDMVNCELVAESASELLNSVFTYDVCSINDIPVCDCQDLPPFTGGEPTSKLVGGNFNDNLRTISKNKSNLHIGFGCKLFPNPFKDGFTINTMLPDESKITIKVFDGIGQKLIEEEYSGKKGINSYEIKFEDQLSKNGLYNVLIMDDHGNQEIHKVVRIK